MFGSVFQHTDLCHGRWNNSICLYRFVSVYKPIKIIYYPSFIVGIGGLGIIKVRNDKLRVFVEGQFLDCKLHM
ncbi:hypothetical protein QVD17_42059 [Tagetes erecta]|uniref:Uncharacterized protein n=1 Tax=Tagetes erecta TaxID=13708 RepID=A0AAD8JNE4_TARER|nr:hypothetical protein QVD17_42059 [Tagetes erecta]